MDKKYTIEQIKEKVILQNNDKRPFEKHIFQTDGWNDGSQDIIVYVQKGSPAKSIIIVNKGRYWIRTFVQGKMNKYSLDNKQESKE